MKILKLTQYASEGGVVEAESYINLDTFSVTGDGTHDPSADPACIATLLRTMRRVVRDEGGNGTPESAHIYRAESGGGNTPLKVIKATFEEVPAV